MSTGGASERRARRPPGRANTVVAAVLVALAVALGLVAAYIPQVLDPIRARLGTLPSPRPRPPPDAGQPPPSLAAPAPDAGAAQASPAPPPSVPAEAFDAGAPARARPESPVGKAKPSRKKRR
jgi:hypothetical protein